MANPKAVKQELFAWEGLNKKGERTKGEIHGPSVALAKAELRRQGINPLKVRKKPKPLFGGKSKKITAKDISILSRQLATMMSSGVPLVQAFEIIGRGHENAGVQDLVNAVKTDVEAGTSLTDSLRKHPRQFDDLYCNLVQAGEQAGILDNLLDKIATYKEKTEAIKGKIKKALFYPAAIVVAAFIVTTILLLFVVPQFESLFSGFGADLPALTRMVIDMSEFMQARWWLILIVLIGVGYGIVQAKRRSVAFQRGIDRVSLRLPIVGPILRKAAIARYARTLSTMFAAGVPLVEAMESVAGAVGNSVYYDAIMRMRDQVAGGTQLQASMRDANVFPNMVVQMVAIGEEAGSLDGMLSKVADFYEQEVDDAVDGLSTLLEPVIMGVLGVLVGGLVIAMYLPIFQMGQVV